MTDLEVVDLCTPPPSPPRPAGQPLREVDGVVLDSDAPTLTSAKMPSRAGGEGAGAVGGRRVVLGGRRVVVVGRRVVVDRVIDDRRFVVLGSGPSSAGGALGVPAPPVRRRARRASGRPSSPSPTTTTR